MSDNPNDYPLDEWPFEPDREPERKECPRCGNFLNADGTCDACIADKTDEYRLPNDVKTRL